MTQPKQPWRVHVLCAQWCGVCRDYQAFVREQQAKGAEEWVWVDIENEARSLGELDVENFPTLFITEGEALRFGGTVTPQPEVALRLLQSLHEGNRYALPDIEDLPELIHGLLALPVERT